MVITCTTRPTCSARAVDPSLPFEAYGEILFHNFGSAQVIMKSCLALNLNAELTRNEMIWKFNNLPKKKKPVFYQKFF